MTSNGNFEADRSKAMQNPQITILSLFTFTRASPPYMRSMEVASGPLKDDLMNRAERVIDFQFRC